MEHSRIKKRNVALIENASWVVSVLRVYSESLRVTLISSIPIPVRVISGCHVADLVCGGHFFFFCHEKWAQRGLSCLTELAIKFPRTRRLVIADDDIEARLIGSLSPSPLDGVLSKASTLEIFHQELFLSLNGVRQRPTDWTISGTLTKAGR